MDDKEKMNKRFAMKKEDIEITFVPQCCRCVKNIDFIKCESFPDGKPGEYMSNQSDCPVPKAYL